MILIVVAVLLLTIVRYSIAVRREQSLLPLGEIAVSALGGLLAGVVLGIAARGGMAAITIANGSAPRSTWNGTLSVIGAFAAIGGAIGIAYAGLFRHRLNRSGVAFGALLGIVTGIPLTHSARQLIANPLPLSALVAVSAFAICVMWFPYAMALEWIVARLMRCSSMRRAARTTSSAK